jgi:RsiW-degrading membrane proteinase PrsW (M82 family)
VRLTLTIESGSCAGRSLELESGRLVIGRDASCGLRLEETTEVSRRHASVTQEPGGLVLADEGSTNGTYLNGARIERAALQDGDVIRLGHQGPRLRAAVAAVQAAPAQVVATRLPAPRPLLDQSLYDPMRDKGRRYSPSALVVGIGMLAAGGVLGLLVALLSVFSLGFGAALVGVVVAFAAAPLYLAVWLWLDRNDPEPAWILAALLAWGGGAATFVSGIVNDAFHGVTRAVSQDAQLAAFLSASVSAPLIEEATKGLAILLLLLFLRREFDGVIDGIVFAGVVALGFATVENVLYYGRAVSKHGVGGLVAVFILRGVLGPFGHAVYTSMTGIGCGIARQTHNAALRVLAPVMGYGFAVFLHALWNFLASVAGVAFLAIYVLFWLPLFVVFFGIVVYMGVRESRLIRKMLELEVTTGLLTQDQADLVASWTRRLGFLVSALGDRGRLRARRDFLYAATRLALCYWHVSRAQAEGGVTMSFGEIPRFRASVKRLQWAT